MRLPVYLLNFFVFILVAIPFCSCTNVSPQSLIILSAGGAKPAMDEIRSVYNEKYHVDVKVSYGGAGELLQQMEFGNFGDVYIAPEQTFMDLAVENGDVDTATCITVAYMIPAIAVSKGNPRNIRSLADLAQPGIRVAITHPETTLLGRLAPDIFEQAGLLADIESNIVAYASDPNNLMYFITTGNVDAGIIWHFYQTYSDDLEIIFMAPGQLTGIGEMQAAVTAYSSEVAESKRFLDFLVSEGGREIFEKHGYITDAEEVKKYWK